MVHAGSRFWNLSNFLRESWWPCNRVAGPGWLVGTGSSGSHEVDSPQRSTTDDRRTGREIAVEFPYTFPFHSVSFSFIQFPHWCCLVSDCKYFFSRPASKSCTNETKDAWPRTHRMTGAGWVKIVSIHQHSMFAMHTTSCKGTIQQIRPMTFGPWPWRRFTFQAKHPSIQCNYCNSYRSRRHCIVLSGLGRFHSVTKVPHRITSPSQPPSHQLPADTLP